MEIAVKIGPEDEIQIAFFEWAAWALPDSVTAFWVPNGLGKFSPALAKWAKRMGLKAGVSDIVVVWPGHVAFIEVKSPRGIITDAQAQFLGRMGVAGHFTSVCRSVDDIISTLRIAGCPIKEKAQ